jgi:hypothetical protein
MWHKGLVIPKLNLIRLMAIYISIFPLLLISFYIEPLTRPPGQPFGAVADYRGLGIFLISKVIETKVLVKAIRSGLRLVVSGTIIRGTLKAPNSQLVTPISIKLQRPDGCD